MNESHGALVEAIRETNEAVVRLLNGLPNIEAGMQWPYLMDLVNRCLEASDEALQRYEEATDDE